MKIRGERECQECGTRWSYYETGSIGCPACGSLHSVGTDDRTEHTDQQVAFDLTTVRSDIDDASIDDLADRARDRCREYVRRRGFINAGELCDLDETYLTASELHHVADIVAREFDLEEREELYFLALLRDGDEGERPPPDDVPTTLRAGRGIAYANAVREYRRDVRTWIDVHDRDLAAGERSTLETLGEHVTRIRMLEGDVSPRTAERLIEATRDLADGLRGDELALGRAQDRLAALEGADERG
ncbi:TFIIB-type zinc ribbon-containing protein [Natrarchaeobius halalkaliphilus]|uniref:TFIIB-type zinc ribbon-containing protein n=1 Tax=Natrarchaeobius halalkaliphilus TaxID=1679091 RepID=A0A3N6LPR6_9EURY|nr:TFIIB-type zinc ribbon-containing protein [Natrarchaeobius halalkaliphilus]RQG91493.1 TFIIB-type zinc ribbon-containing protein [Natrarchaeobius halalkaliphilus]